MRAKLTEVVALAGTLHRRGWRCRWPWSLSPWRWTLPPVRPTRPPIGWRTWPWARERTGATLLLVPSLGTRSNVAPDGGNVADHERRGHEKRRSHGPWVAGMGLVQNLCLLDPGRSSRSPHSTSVLPEDLASRCMETKRAFRIGTRGSFLSRWAGDELDKTSVPRLELMALRGAFQSFTARAFGEQVATSLQDSGARGHHREGYHWSVWRHRVAWQVHGYVPYAPLLRSSRRRSLLTIKTVSFHENIRIGRAYIR